MTNQEQDDLERFVAMAINRAKRERSITVTPPRHASAEYRRELHYLFEQHANQVSDGKNGSAFVGHGWQLFLSK